MSDISKVKLPDNNTYDIKDATARFAIDDIVNGTTQLPYTLIKDADDTAKNLIKLGTGLSLDANNVLSASGSGAKVHIMTFVDGVCQRLDGEPIMDAQIGDFLLFYGRMGGVTIPDYITSANLGSHLAFNFTQFPKYSVSKISIPTKNFDGMEMPVLLQIVYPATSSTYYCSVVNTALGVDFYQGTRAFTDSNTAPLYKAGVRLEMTVNTEIAFKNNTTDITPVATYKNVYESNRLVYSIYCSSQVYLKDVSFTITESNNEIFIPEFLDGGSAFGKIVYDSATGVYTVTNVAATTRNKCLSVVGRFYKYYN